MEKENADTSDDSIVIIENEPELDSAFPTEERFSCNVIPEARQADFTTLNDEIIAKHLHEELNEVKQPINSDEALAFQLQQEFDDEQAKLTTLVVLDIDDLKDPEFKPSQKRTRSPSPGTSPRKTRKSNTDKSYAYGGPPSDEDLDVRVKSLVESGKSYYTSFYQIALDDLVNSRQMVPELGRQLMGQVHLVELQQGEDLRRSCARNIKQRIMSAIGESPNNPDLIRLASFEADHFSWNYGDSAWGCGYRNIQLLLSNILNHPVLGSILVAKLGNCKMPSIPKLQVLISEAWNAGFDASGRAELEKDRPLQGSRTWIGTPEVAALLGYFGFEYRIHQISKAREMQTADYANLFEALIAFVKSEFAGGDYMFPIYFQEDGHSRTIFGYEESVRGTDKVERKLYVLDPAHKLYQTELKNLLRRIRRLQTTFKNGPIEMVTLTGNVLSDGSCERLKNGACFTYASSLTYQS